jgi:hypothetical protein
MPFRPPAPLSPDILGVTVHRSAEMPGVHTETTAMPPLSAPPVVRAPNQMYASPIGNHPPQNQRQARRVPNRTSTVPLPTTGATSQGHIIQAATHQIHQPSFLNRVQPVFMPQRLLSQPPLTNRSVGNANPTPQPADGQRRPVSIPIQYGNRISNSIFSGTSDCLIGHPVSLRLTALEQFCGTPN